ncbi:MAG: DUF2589 domain-containing protein [Rikenellaceae bacterium]|nr:DUF2589 domain-containing protein [Rikenellaceae bacterium]
MADKKIRTTNTQVLELQQLIAGPLIATIEADSLSSRSYLDYLMQIAFDSYDPKTGKTGNIRMFTFSYTSQDVNGKKQQTVSIPMLTLVPLPLLQVQEADFDFDIKILDAYSEKEERKFSLEEGREFDDPETTGEFKMRASLAPKQSQGDSGKEVQQSLSANMKIKVKMRQADMPAGLSNLLHLTASNVHVEETEAEIISEKGGENEQ